MASFDPYLNWLGIPPHEQPPSFYRLLGLVLFEANPEVIGQAADRQSLHVGSFQSGPHGELCQQILSELAMARFCLLDPQQKSLYDGQLSETLAHRGERSVAAPPPPAAFAGGPQYQAPQHNMPQVYGAPMGSGPMHGGNGGMTQPMMPSMAPAMAMNPAQMAPAQMPVPQMMPAQGGYAPAPFPRAAAPIAQIPVAQMSMAAPFPAAAPHAPSPMPPPSAPPRPIDELESLTSQPSRRRFVRKKKTDYSKEMVIGGVVAAAAAILVVIFIAINNSNSKHGWSEMQPETPQPPAKVYPTEKELKEKAKREEARNKKIITKPDASPLREKEPPAIEKRTAARKASSADKPGIGAVLRTHPGEGGKVIGPQSVESPSQELDSPDPAAAPDSSKPDAKKPDEKTSQHYSGTGGRDGPAGAGGPDDPVFEKPTGDQER